MAACSSMRNTVIIIGAATVASRSVSFESDGHLILWLIIISTILFDLLHQEPYLQACPNGLGKLQGGSQEFSLVSTWNNF